MFYGFLVLYCAYIGQLLISFWVWVWFQNSTHLWSQKWCQKKTKNQGTETRHELCVSDFCPPTFCHVLAPVLGHLYDSKRHPTLEWKSIAWMVHCSGQSLPLVKGDALKLCNIRLLLLEDVIKCECLFGVKPNNFGKMW